MRLVIATPALALCLLALQGSNPPAPLGEPVALLTGIVPCDGGNTVEGDLRPDPEYGTAFWHVFVSVPSRSPVIWPTGFTGLRLVGGGVAILDGARKVVASTDGDDSFVVVPWSRLRGQTLRLAEAIGGYPTCIVGARQGPQTQLPIATPALTPAATIDSRVEVGQPSIVLWDHDGRAAGQVVVELTNVADDWVTLYPEGDPGRGGMGRGSSSFATIRTRDGSLITGIETGSSVAFDGYPRLLAPGQSGYLVATFDYADIDPTDLVVDTTLVFGGAQPGAEPPNVTFGRTKVSVVRGDQVEVASSIKRKGARGVTFVGVAYDANGTVLGFVEQWWGVTSDGKFSICCLPPTVRPETVADVRWVAVARRPN